MFRLLEILFVVKLYAHADIFYKSVSFGAAILIWFFETNVYYDLVLLINRRPQMLSKITAPPRQMLPPKCSLPPQRVKIVIPPRNSF